MEEKPKPRFRLLFIVCALSGTIAGSVGALLGVTMTSRRDLFNLPEALVVNAIVGGALIGLGIGVTVAWLRPRREEWYGCIGWGVLMVCLIGFSAVACALLAGIATRYLRA